MNRNSGIALVLACMILFNAAGPIMGGNILEAIKSGERPPAQSSGQSSEVGAPNNRHIVKQPQKTKPLSDRPGRVIASIGLNVRSGPGINHSKVGVLSHGTMITIIGENNGWYKIKYGGGVAWVCGRYVNVRKILDTSGAKSTSIFKIKVPGAESIRIHFRSKFLPTTATGIQRASIPEIYDAAGNKQPKIIEKIGPWIYGDTLYLLFKGDIESIDGLVEKVERYDTNKFYGELAAHWASSWYQDVDDTSAAHDYIVAVNFDNNFIGNDNWENSEDNRFAFQGSFLNEAVIYWWVVDTYSHYYLGYADFHPRDWVDTDSGISKLQSVLNRVSGHDSEHENDMEGAVLIIRKDESRYGHLEMIQTQAHNNYFQYSNEKCLLPNYSKSNRRKKRKRREDIDGEIMKDSMGKNKIFIEAKGHGVYGSHKKTDYNESSGDGQIYYYVNSIPEGKNYIVYRCIKELDNVLRPETSGPNESDDVRYLHVHRDDRDNQPVDYSLWSIKRLWEFYKNPS
ncbi:MAG: SH3 domain-containing protein, partial [bacterium]|nr:SH3 domain-containing protein [bacterium]